MPDEATAALAKAADTGDPVEVLSLRDEYTQVFAETDGQSLMQESSSSPVFGRNAEGELAEIDTTLELVDGAIRPVATALGLVLPAGPGETLDLSYEGSGLELGLPGTLSAPTLDGATARYADVFPGVDLLLTATPDGVSQVYEVRTPEAAAAAPLEQLVFPVEAENGDLVPRTGGGSMFIDSFGEVAFASGPALMWDSSSDELTPESVPETDPAEVAQEDYAAPSPYDQREEMAVKVTDAGLRVTPDAEFLADPETVYPVFIDPDHVLGRGERTMLRSDGEKSWQFNDPDGEGVGRCPTSYDSSCKGPYRKRLFYEFGRGDLNAGDQVMRAEFVVKETHAASCTKTPVDLVQTGEISPAWDWPGPGVIKQIDSRTVAYGRAGCPAANVEFGSDALLVSARNLADGDLGRLTLSLRAGNESDQLGWKRFSDDAVLRVWYVRKPGVPTGVGVAVNGVPLCGENFDDREMIDSNYPRLKATVQTAVRPGLNAPPGKLRAAFQLQVRRNGTWIDVVTHKRPATGGDADGSPQVLDFADLPRRLPNDAYRFKVWTESFYDIEQAGSGWLQGGSSDWCHFGIDEGQPLPPLVTSKDGRYPEEIAGVIRWGGKPGQFGDFLYRPDPTDPSPNIVRYKTELTGVGTAVDGAVGNDGSATARVTPSSAGPYYLSVKAYDRNQRAGASKVYRFNVQENRPPVGYWHVRAGDTTTIADSATGPEARPLTLSSLSLLAGAGFGRRGKLTVGADTDVPDYALRFNGTGGQARSQTYVLDTSTSFTLSAWAMLTNTDQDRVLVSQFNEAGTEGFDLRYSKAANAWTAGWTYRDATGTHVRRSTAPVPAVKDAWTQVSAVYDDATKTIQLFLNGRPSGAPLDVSGAATPSATNGPLIVGRGGTAITTTAPFHGLIDEIQAWKNTVEPAELSQSGTQDDEGNQVVTLVRSWRASVAAGTNTATTIQDSSVFGHTASVLRLEGDAVKDTAAGQVLFSGNGGLAATGPMLDETGSFTVSADITVDDQAMAGRDRARIVGQQAAGGNPSWALWFVKTGVQNGRAIGMWTFGRWSAPGQLRTAQTDPEDQEHVILGTQTRINVVYSANLTANQICIYGGINPDEIGCADYDAPVQGAGEMTVGMSPAGPGLGRTDFLVGRMACLHLYAGAATPTGLKTLAGCN